MSATRGCATGSSFACLTDEPEISGWGEATLEWHTRSVVGAVGDLEPLLIGQDPDARRVPLAADEPPALLARQRPRPCDGDQRHRHRALGHRRQGLRRSVPSSLGRAGARLRSGSTRTSAEGSFYALDEPEALRRAGARARRGRLHGVQVPAGAADACRSRGLGDRAGCRAASRRCAMRWATGSTSWSTATRGPRPRSGSRFAHALEPFDLYWLEEPCWPEVPDAIADIARSVRDAHRDRRATRRDCTRSATCSSAGRAR